MDLSKHFLDIYLKYLFYHIFFVILFLFGSFFLLKINKGDNFVPSANIVKTADILILSLPKIFAFTCCRIYIFITYCCFIHVTKLIYIIIYIKISPCIEYNLKNFLLNFLDSFLISYQYVLYFLFSKMFFLRKRYSHLILSLYELRITGGNILIASKINS